MDLISGFDHVAITVADIELTCAFYAKLFGARRVAEYARAGKVLVRQIAVGSAVLSIHQLGNGINLAAIRPTPGSADFCLRWNDSIASAAKLLRDHEIPIVEGPCARRTSEGLPSMSVYFSDPDGNLVELMAAD